MCVQERYIVAIKGLVSTNVTAGSWVYAPAGLHWSISEATAAVCLEVLCTSGSQWRGSSLERRDGLEGFLQGGGCC